MLIEVDVRGGLRRLRIEGELNIYTAPELKQQLLDHLAAALLLEVDLSRVSELDTAGLQVLYLARREAGDTGKALSVTALSSAVKDVLGLFGVAAWFTVPTARTESPP